MNLEWHSTALRGKTVPAEDLESQRSKPGGLKLGGHTVNAFLDLFFIHLKLLSNLGSFIFQNNKEHILRNVNF